jgi:hypothetical protein
MVLLAAEVVGICYYHLLSSRLPDGGLKNLLTEIVADEKSHLQFHCCFFRIQMQDQFNRLLFILTWRSLMFAAAVVVLIDHRHALRDLGISPGIAWRRWMVYSRTAENLVSLPRRRPVVHLATR